MRKDLREEKYGYIAKTVKSAINLNNLSNIEEIRELFSVVTNIRNALKITPYKSVFKPSDSIVPFTNFSKVCQIDVIHLLV